MEMFNTAEKIVFWASKGTKNWERLRKQTKRFVANHQSSSCVWLQLYLLKTRWDSFVFWVVHKVKFILSDWQLLVPGSQQYLTELFKAGWRVIRVPGLQVQVPYYYYSNL